MDVNYSEMLSIAWKKKAFFFLFFLFLFSISDLSHTKSLTLLRC